MSKEGTLIPSETYRFITNRSIYSLILRLVTTMVSWQSSDDKTKSALEGCMSELLASPINEQEATRFNTFMSKANGSYDATTLQISFEQNQLTLTFVNPASRLFPPVSVVINERIPLPLKRYPLEAVRKIRLAELVLSPRVLRALKNEAIETVGDLLSKASTRRDLLKLPLIGEKAVYELGVELAQLGVELP